MFERAFITQQPCPDDSTWRQTLGRALVHWETLTHFLETQVGSIQWEWKYYSTGWTLKTLLKKRNLFFVIPIHNVLKVSLIFGDKAVAAVVASTVPAAWIRELQTARKYAEGRGLALELRTAKDVAHFQTLVQIKLAN